MVVTIEKGNDKTFTVIEKLISRAIQKPEDKAVVTIGNCTYSIVTYDAEIKLEIKCTIDTEESPINVLINELRQTGKSINLKIRLHSSHRM